MFSCKEYMAARDELFHLFDTGVISRQEWMIQHQMMQDMI